MLLPLRIYPLGVLSILLSCCAFCTPALADPNSAQFELMQRSSILFGLTTISRPDMVSASCYGQLQDIQKAILQQQPWAMKMYDATGSREPGFVTGNGLWLGSRDSCNAVKQPVNLKISKHIAHKMNSKLITDIAPFPVDFRVVHLWHNSTWQMDPNFPYFEPRVSIGLCLPTACTLSEIAQLMAIYVEDEIFVANDIFNLRLRVDSVKELKMRPGSLARPSWIIFSVAWSLTLLLTAMALVRRMKRNNETAGVVADGDRKTNSADVAVTKPESSAKPLAGKGYLDCFDVKNNWELLFPVDAAGVVSGNDAFPGVNGLRFYGAMGVILFHQLCVTYLATSNKSEHFKFISNLGNFEVFVDLFFTISGFLQTYHFFRNPITIDIIRKSGLWKNVMLILMYLLHRLIRLGPLYLIAICMSDAGSRMMDDLSVFHFSHRVYEKCELYWWRNALFIQNLFNHEDMCMFWSWSSACDMQFFIISTILLFVYVKHPKVAKALTLSILAANLAYTFYIGLTMNFQYSWESTSSVFTELYMHPLSRVFAYIIGGVAGWFFVQNQKHQLYAGFFQNQSLQEFLGYLAIIVFFTCNYTTIATGYSILYYVVLLVLQRLLFSASVCCLIFANAAGSVKWFFGVLENPIFKKFNQITYALFLMNPMNISLVTGFGNASINMTPLRFLSDYIGYCAVLYFFCTIFTLFFEVPYKNISRLMLQRAKEKLI
ncbi:O-acyltransferase like protein-like [Rhagoletis pomonella]|uniref:O-acyltransferase like protein-like n=1 Tax=Rhagoletis pomonella TaxID=28610 RepID=UPI0017805273|nr:O-acyltransferase like protein-like [Rhagoletis pomonella]XP_036343423.1 O-acyltransferase like protein-like [Rhagoletis pomonella]